MHRPRLFYCMPHSRALHALLHVHALLHHRVGTPTLRTLLTHRPHHAILADGPPNATMQEVIELGRLELRTPLDAVVELVWQWPSAAGVGWA